MTRELDAEIAEKVMGWRVARNEEKEFWDFSKVEGAWSHGDFFKPSMNISDAWLVVEKMRERGYDTVIAAGNGCCRVSVHPAMQPHQSVHNPFLAMITAETAPLAICRAALEACNGEP